MASQTYSHSSQMTLQFLAQRESFPDQARVHPEGLRLRHGDKYNSTGDDAVESAITVDTGPYEGIPKETVSFSSNPQID